MTDKDHLIREGDTVMVRIGPGFILSHKAKVINRPCATGDSWIFEDLIYGDVHYVSEGCTVTKKPKLEQYQT